VTAAPAALARAAPPAPQPLDLPPAALSADPCGPCCLSAWDRRMAAQVNALSYGELAVALYASDMPTRRDRSRHDPVQVGAWARQGMERLGPARIMELEARSTRAVLASNEAAFDAVWPNWRRGQAAHDLAYRHLSPAWPTGTCPRHGGPAVTR
jgi:hypothetical protein